MKGMYYLNLALICHVSNIFSNLPQFLDEGVYEI